MPRKFLFRKISLVAALGAIFIALASMGAGVRAQNEAGPVPTRTPMNIPHIPQLTVQALPGYGAAPLFVGFMVGSSNPEGAPFTMFRWNFGDGQVSALPPTALFHTYKTPGSYVVTVTATTSDGHQATGFAGVLVQPATR
ncbi:MAG: PKD domain-containing protein [Candidatus Binatus sp.]|uniref:PKD domain-containing protein n=1 Tax=Candidatus Binatus sp. TaxID=2811406 RepID=UPI002721F6C4|nr:PKD domain-containing protein [Candidatus Binatus sp.]MDO8431180.1 PKD domain-containing protein [Candidatus Binatus sp.]